MTTKTDSGHWVLTYRSTDGSTQTEDRDGISWHRAPLPRRFHRCIAQTVGWVDYSTAVYRCACGARSVDDGPWEGKNERRKLVAR